MGDDLTVGVLSPLLAGSFFGQVVQGLARHVATLGGRVLAVQTLDATLGDDYTGLPPFSTPVGWEQVAGFVTIINAVGKSYLQDIRALGKPVVMVSHHVPGFVCPEVLPDNRIGIVEAVRHLVEHGHNRIAFAGNISQADISERYDAYLATLKESGLSPEDELLFVAPDNLDAGGAAVAEAVLAAGLPCTAVVAATDYNARGILRTLQGAGVNVPKEFAVTGFRRPSLRFAALAGPRQRQAELRPPRRARGPPHRGHGPGQADAARGVPGEDVVHRAGTPAAAWALPCRCGLSPRHQ